MLQDSFSSDGYIVNQGLATDAPYGVFFSSRNGCGWISAFNLLLSCGFPASPGQVRRDLERRLWLHGLIGTNPFTLYQYLKRILMEKGLLLKKAFRISSAYALVSRCSAGILLYWHGSGCHYAAFYRHHGDKFRFLNVHYGDQHHFASFQEFLNTENRAPLLFVMGIPDTRLSSEK